MSGKDVREFLYTNMRAQRRYETDDSAPSPSVSFDPQKDDRVLVLLNQLGERLIRSERERLEMKETVGRYSDLISALENKIDRQALAEEELRQRQEKMERDYAAQMQKMEKAVMLAERIEDAINQQNRLARRIDQITQDKARMLRKLERIEEAVVETQTTLNAKSLVLTTDQNRAVNDPSARIARPANDDDSMWQSSTLRRLASTTAVFVLVAALSWGVYKSIPQSNFSRADARTVSADALLATPPFAAPPAAEENATDVRRLADRQHDESPYIEEAPANIENLITPEERQAEVPVETATETIVEAPAPVIEEPVVAAPAPATVTPDPVPVAPLTTTDVAPNNPADDILSRSDDELVAMLNDDPDALASALNNIAPGAAGLPQGIDAAPSTPPAVEIPVAVQPTVPVTPPPAASAPQETVVNDFLGAQKDSRPLSQRIQPDPSLPAALKEVENKAFQGIPEAQHDLAALYTAGQNGVKTDFTRAAQWFEEAALNNIPNARYNLGVLYHQGLGVTQDTAKAINWYKAAAAQNHPEAQYNLGIAYIEGVGTEYSPQKAAANFESAARSGILEAAYNLGLIYENGLLGSPQIDDAIYWYNRAAVEGSPEGKAALNQLAKNMGYSESRVQDIYNNRKAVIEGTPAVKTQKQTVAHQPAIMTPISAPATNNTVKPAADAIPVLPLDGEMLAPAEPPTQRKNSRSSSRNVTRDAGVIAQIQEQLMNAGLYPGPADGIYNDVMSDAIRSYQRTHELDTDGRASEALLVHMLSQDSGTY